MKGVEFVFHLAAAFRELNVPNSFYDEVNVEGTRNVLHAARRAGVRKFVYCSTCGVHGNVEHPPADEDAPIRPADYYQRTKYEAEPLVKREAGDLEVVILRPAAIYGPGDPERFFMIFQRVARGTFPMFGSGRTLYHPLYIDNLVDAFLLCMPPGVGRGREYLIADEKYYPIEEIVQRGRPGTGCAGSNPALSRSFRLWPWVTWWKRFVARSESHRRSFPGEWTGIARTGHSTSPAPNESWGTNLASSSIRAFGSPGPGTARWDTCDCLHLILRRQFGSSVTPHATFSISKPPN